MNRRSLRWTAGLAALGILMLFMAAAQGLPTRAAASLTSSDSAQIRFEGYLQAKSPGQWTVGDFTVRVDQQTDIIEKSGSAEIGAWLIVWAVNDVDGDLRAEIIYVDRSAGQPSPAIQFTGVLNKKSDEWWVVGQTLVHIRPDNVIGGNPEVKSLVSVTGEEQDGVFEADTAEMIAETPMDVPVEFEGRIEAIGPDAWQVQGQPVEITAATNIVGQGIVGKDAEVKALRATDGSLWARLIRVLDQPAEVTLGAMVTNIVSDATGSQFWDMIVFPDKSWDEPYLTTIRVAGNTLIDESRTVAQPGKWAEVRAQATNQGSYQADLIRLEQPIPVSIKGSFQQASSTTSSGGWWQVHGRRIWVSRQDVLASAAYGEGNVTIQGLLLGNGIIWAKQIRPSQTPGH